MKKIKISVVALLIGMTSIATTSCIGSFALTKSVLNWNKGIDNKVVNELVFVAFWILPVYEVSALADLLVLNSIEFWSGNNPMTSSVKVVDTEQGRYFIACDGTGYTITHEPTNRQYRLKFTPDTQTWSLDYNNETIPFMTFIDKNHVKMITPDGIFQTVELSEQGVMAYQQTAFGGSSMPYNLAMIE